VLMMCRKKIIVVLALMVAALASAASGPYLNFHDDGVGNAFISQSVEKCDSCSFSIQLDSLSMTGYVLDTLLKNVWKPIEQADGTTYGTISLNSDLDLDQFKSSVINFYDNAIAGCSAVHYPLTFKAQKGKFNGNGHSISNMCYTFAVEFDNMKMTAPVGFFEKLDSVEVSDVKFRKVKISISGSSATSLSCTNCFYSVGALAGEAHNSSFEGITLDSVYVNSLLAGGVVGLSWNSSYSDITSGSPVNITNFTVISNTSDVSPVKNVTWTNIYTAFLGGVAGYAVNSNYSKIDLAVRLGSSNGYYGNYAVMGGVAGLNSYEKNSNLDLVMDELKIHGAAEEMALIYGGSTMGGLFGTIRPYGGSSDAVTSDVTIRNSSFNGKIYAAPSYASEITVGGFIGYDGQANSSVRIQKSTSNFAFEENRLTRDSLYAAGGFVGMGPSGAPSGSGYLSITSSKATGSITYKSLATSTSKPTSFYAGGLAGFAFFNIDDKAISNVVVDVPIAVTIKQADASDEVAVGGLVGKAGINDGDGRSMVVSSASYTGGIRLDGKMGNTYVGGAIGHFYKGDNKGSISFENISISKDSLITVGSESETYGNSFAGGLCGRCTSPNKISSVGVFGDISIDGSFAEADSVFVGGLIGKINASGNMAEFNMINDFYIGKISSSKSGDYAYLGYLAGLLRMTSGSTSYVAKSNYHYGTDEVEAFGDFYGIGGKGWDDVKVCGNGTLTQCWDKSRNVRNGSVSNILDGDSNGVVVGAYVKSSDMVKFLNAPWDENEKVWELDKSRNNGFPEQKGLKLISTEGSSSSVTTSSSSAVSASSSSAVVASSSSKNLENSSSSKVVDASSAASFNSEDVVVSSSSHEQVSVASCSSEYTEDLSGEDKGHSSSSEVNVSESSSSEIFEVSSSSAKTVVMQTGSWNMVSFKLLESKGYKLTQEDVLYWWNENNYVGDYWQYQAYSAKDEIDDARGYWLWNADEISVAEDRGNIPEDAEISWTLDSVYSGWNMVANPYGWTVDLTGAELSGLEIWRRNSVTGGFERPDELKPYEGVWVKSHNHDVVAFAAKPAAKSLKKALAKSNFENSDGWTLKASLSDDFGKLDSWNVIGTASRALSEEEPPSNMGDHVSLSIVDGKRRLAKSLVEESDEVQWTINLKASSDREGYLKLDGIGQVNALGKKVYVTIGNRVTEMTEGKSLKVSLKKSASTAVVTVTSGDKPVVAGKSITDLRGVRTADGLNVNFETSTELAGYNAKVELVSVSGKVAATAEFTAMAGNNSVSLKLPERGLYVIRLRVGSQIATRNVVVQ